MKNAKNLNIEFSSHIMKSFFFENSNPDCGHCTLTCHHKINELKEYYCENGAVIYENYYTHPLIPPYLQLNHPGADSYNLKENTLKNDSDFIQAYQAHSWYYLSLCDDI